MHSNPKSKCTLKPSLTKKTKCILYQKLTWMLPKQLSKQNNFLEKGLYRGQITDKVQPLLKLVIIIYFL